MENSIYLGLSKQMVLRTNMDIIANNIANMNTNGFRGQYPIFEEYISDPARGDDDLSFVLDYGQYQMTAPGPLEATGNDLNVGLIGDGFIGVTLPDGSLGFTRDGNFGRAQDGTLVSSAGYPIAGTGGKIVIPEGALEVIIDQNGTVSTQDGVVGALQVVEFENLQELEPRGNNVYVTTGAYQEATNTRVKQGFLEGSNINPVNEMTRMIEISRAYQSTAKLLDDEHERLRGTISKLTKTS